MARTTLGASAGAGTSCSAHHCAMRSGMSPGATKRGSWTSKTGTGPVTSAAAASRAPRSSRPHVRRVSLSSHVPITLVRKRMVPSTPPSWVKLAARAASVSTGFVELEADEAPGAERDVGRAVTGHRYADDRGGGVVRARRPRPAGPAHRRPSPTCGRSAPMVAPGSTRSARRPRGRLRAAMSSSSQAPVVTDSRPVVEALVRSATSAPVSQWASRSGTRSSAVGLG